MAVADRNGLPIACGIASGQRHEAKLVVDTLKARFTRPMPKLLIGDKAYDSDPLDAALAARGIELISPNRTSRKVQTQDRRKLPRYKRRWRIERLFAWLMRCRRLVTRYETNSDNFLGFLRLACAQLLWKRL